MTINREETKGMSLEELQIWVKEQQKKQDEMVQETLRATAEDYLNPDKMKASFMEEWNRQTDEVCRNAFH
jgi:Txe/YoeB family toxin of Txe-Axe toxin-antitoxin module